jgi:alpha-methylacyl-CoA racemase
MDRKSWPALKARFAEVFKARTQAEWCAVFEGSDACVAPVLSITEAQAHPHNAARNAFVRVGDVPQPAPAPRFSRSIPAVQSPPEQPGASTDRALHAWGFSADEISALRAQGAIA